jgi:O-antigen/teichoic acid export membrane protein
MSNLKKHFIYKLITNVIRIPIQIILQSIYPRILGPVSYGNFDFLTDTSNKIINFIDSGLSVAFYTKLSQNYNDRKLVKFYAYILSLISLVYFTFIIISSYHKIYNHIWPNQEYIYITFSALVAILTFFSNSILKMVDASELTFEGENIKILQLFISIFIFYVVYKIFKKIDLNIFYFLQILLLFILVFGNIYILKKNNLSIFPKTTLTKIEYNYYLKQFWNYSSPLLLTGIISLIVGFGERWILQSYGGSVQQSYFALSYKISSFVFLFTGAMMPLFMREISKHYSNNEKEKISTFFLKNVKILFFVVCFMATIVSLNSSFVTYVLGGSLYKDAGLVVFLMSFYPIHQTIGQINGTLYLSTNRTKEYTKISLFFSPLVLLFSFLLMGPSSQFGLNLGATGLAIEMLLVQFISQNVLLYFNCKYLRISFLKITIFQILTLTTLLLVGYFEKILIYYLIKNIFVAGISHSIIYSITILFIVYNIPNYLGFNLKANLIMFFYNIKNKIF